jgi:hypothetical protein
MKKLLLLFLFPLGLYAQEDTYSIEGVLYILENVIFEKLEHDQEDQYDLYELFIYQPLDHTDLSRGTFYQKAYLTHKGFDRPMIMHTDGYEVDENSLDDLAILLDANQLFIEHRYFGESMPDSLDYTYLTARQAAEDHHYINSLFRPHYKGKWLSTGYSKGGVASILYKYYFPEDVDLAVPMVAPINNSLEDKRIYKFLDTVSTSECRERIRDFQVRLFEERESVLDMIDLYLHGTGEEYGMMSLEEIFEVVMLELPFSFFQYGRSCDSIPSAKSPLAEAVKYMIKVIDPYAYVDSDLIIYEPHYYQSASELGYYSFKTKPFKAYLEVLPTDKNYSAILLPGIEQTVPFNEDFLKDLHDWLEKEGDDFIYMYGTLDTWTACAVPENRKVDSDWFMLPGKDHNNTSISNLSERERDRFISILEQKLDMDIEYNLKDNGN